MDEILGSNVSKDYNKVGNFVKDGRGLPVIPDISKGGSFSNKANPMHNSMEGIKRPVSQDK